MLGAEHSIKETYVKNGQLLLIFAPVLNHGDLSLQTHQAAECAADQGRFWEFHNILFENQDSFWFSDIQAMVKQLAADAGFDTVDFNACMDEQRHLDLIYEQDQFRVNAGIRGQPVFNINGDLIIGSQPFEVFQGVIDPLLAAE
ncbi:MAG: thioredoxin domain-containing protein [Anaerolineae bacterium]|nr:thioredoxin domain-containing protein [Anaerolineae bacterium]